MWTIRSFALLVAFALWALPAQAETVLNLADDVKEHMPPEQFPTVEAVMDLIPNDDPLADYKRADLLMTMLSMIYRFPHMEPGTWNDLEKRYKRGFKQRQLRWPPPKRIEVVLEQQKFSAYAVLMPAFFPKAYELKPYPSNEHLEEVAIKAVLMIMAGVIVLLVVVLLLRFLRRS